MGSVNVNKSALRAASEQQVGDLWRGTCWWWKDSSSRIIAERSDGLAGLRKLLALKKSISDV